MFVAISSALRVCWGASSTSGNKLSGAALHSLLRLDVSLFVLFIYSDRIRRVIHVELVHCYVRRWIVYKCTSVGGYIHRFGTYRCSAHWSYPRYKAIAMSEHLFFKWPMQRRATPAPAHQHQQHRSSRSGPKQGSLRTIHTTSHRLATPLVTLAAIMP